MSQEGFDTAIAGLVLLLACGQLVGAMLSDRSLRALDLSAFAALCYLGLCDCPYNIAGLFLVAAPDVFTSPGDDGRWGLAERAVSNTRRRHALQLSS